MSEPLDLDAIEAEFTRADAIPDPEELIQWAEKYGPALIAEFRRIRANNAWFRNAISSLMEVDIGPDATHAEVEASTSGLYEKFNSREARIEAARKIRVATDAHGSGSSHKTRRGPDPSQHPSA